MSTAEANRGPMVGGPWDGEEHSVLYCPDEHPGGPPPEVSDRCQVYSDACPEGGLYGWHAESGEWRYEGTPPPNAFSALLKAINGGGAA